MVQARSPCGAEWVRESRPERSQDRVDDAGSSPVTGRRAILGGNTRRATEWGPVSAGFNEGGTAERLLRLRPFWDGGFLRSVTTAAMRRQR
jgi:hypothetical protein